MARETAERYYVVPEKKEGNGKGNGRKVLFCTLKKGGIWQGKQQVGFMFYLKQGGGMARKTAERYYFVP